MKFRSLDNNGDWNFGNGLQNYITNEGAILLNLKTRLLSFLGDCYFDRTAGIDWFNLLTLKSTNENLELIGLEITKIINSTEGITNINDFNLSYKNDDRNLILEYNVDTIFSENQFQILEQIY